MIDEQSLSIFQSSIGLEDKLYQIISAPPIEFELQSNLNAAWFNTKLGPMIAIASDTALYLLEFADQQSLERKVTILKDKTKSAIIHRKTSLINQLENELTLYFSGELKQFTTPVFRFGTPFQNEVWDALCKIPLGETRSYLDIAKVIGKPSACRAVAQANAANQLAIITPCHRVINSNGELGGYSGGITRKKWLIYLEKTKDV